jgi:uncharacterized protein Usg
MKKTKLMLAAEARAGKPLEEALPELLNLYGWQETANRLGVSKGVLSYWNAKLGIRTRSVAIPPGHSLLLVPADPFRRSIDLSEVAA